jgi:hypothetical protein
MLFYHVSKKDHGPVFKFRPKLPESAIINKEGNIPRVCVAPELLYCLRSISSNKQLYSMDIIIECRNEENGWNPPAIYMTSDRPYLPPAVSDFRKNHEHWFIRPIEMVRIGYIDLVALTKGKIEIIKEFKSFTFEEIGGEGKDVPILAKNNLRIGRGELEYMIYKTSHNK